MWHTLIHCNFNKHNCWSTIGFVWGAQFSDNLMQKWVARMDPKRCFWSTVSAKLRISTYLCRINFCVTHPQSHVQSSSRLSHGKPDIQNSFQTQIDLIVTWLSGDPNMDYPSTNDGFPTLLILRLGQRRELLYLEVPSRIPGAPCKNMLEESSIPSDKFT